MKDGSSFTSHGSPTLFQLEIMQKSKEEAHIMADAFRIAFEQQLTRKNDQALGLAHMDKCRRSAAWTNGQHLKDEGNYGEAGVSCFGIGSKSAQERSVTGAFRVAAIRFKFSKCQG